MMGLGASLDGVLALEPRSSVDRSRLFRWALAGELRLGLPCVLSLCLSEDLLDDRLVLLWKQRMQKHNNIREIEYTVQYGVSLCIKTLEQLLHTPPFSNLEFFGQTYYETRSRDG